MDPQYLIESGFSVRHSVMVVIVCAVVLNRKILTFLTVITHSRKCDSGQAVKTWRERAFQVEVRNICKVEGIEFHVSFFLPQNC